MILPKFNLANRVTLWRLVFAAVSCAFLLMLQERIVVIGWENEAAWLALFFFIVATASDALDGYIARRDSIVTAFGRIADPFVDKITICGSLIFLVGTPYADEFFRPWMLVLLLFREFLVTGIRGYMESVGIDFGADMVGKVKMVVQSILVGCLIGLLGFATRQTWLEVTTHVLVWATVVLTLWSGIRYVVRAAGHLSAKDI